MEDEEALKKTGYILLVHAGIILLLAVIMWAGETAATPPSQEKYQEFDSKLRWLAIGVSAVIMGIYWRKLFTRSSFV